MGCVALRYHRFPIRLELIVDGGRRGGKWESSRLCAVTAVCFPRIWREATPIDSIESVVAESCGLQRRGVEEGRACALSTAAAAGCAVLLCVCASAAFHQSGAAILDGSLGRPMIGSATPDRTALRLCSHCPVRPKRRCTLQRRQDTAALLSGPSAAWECRAALTAPRLDEEKSQGGGHSTEQRMTDPHPSNASPSPRSVGAESP